MPKWTSNKINVKGSSNDILSLINLGLKNSGVAEVSADKVDLATIENALSTLVEKGTFRHSDGDITAKGNYEMGIKEERGIYFSTFLPIPDTFIKFDTTNYKDEFADEAAKQMKEYGVVGWYDYNVKYFGCKWDCEIENFEASQNENDEFTLEFETSSPWCPPVEFVVRLSELFPTLVFYGGYVEEFGQSVGYYKVVDGEILEDVDKTDVFNKIQADEDYNEAYDLFLEEYNHFIIV